jgi:hypothetical protein
MPEPPSGNDLIGRHVRVQLDFHVDFHVVILQVITQGMEGKALIVATWTDHADLRAKISGILKRQISPGMDECHTDTDRPVSSHRVG